MASGVRAGGVTMVAPEAAGRRYELAVQAAGGVAARTHPCAASLELAR